MKKISSGIMAVLIAGTLLAFTSSSKSEELTCYYWFPYCNGIVQTISCTVSCQEEDPYSCPGGSFICAAAFLPQDTECVSDASGGLRRRPKVGAVAQVIIHKASSC
jgi:hypothetical protein